MNVIPCHLIASELSFEALSAFLLACATPLQGNSTPMETSFANVLSTFEYLQKKGIVVWKSHLSVSFLFLFCFCIRSKEERYGGGVSIAVWL